MSISSCSAYFYWRRVYYGADLYIRSVDYTYRDLVGVWLHPEPVPTQKEILELWSRTWLFNTQS